MNDIIKIVESLEYSGLLIDCATETVKHKIKKIRLISWCNDGTSLIIASMASSLIEPAISLLINYITGRGQKGRFLQLLAFSGERSYKSQKRIWSICHKSRWQKGTHWVSLFIDKNIDVCLDSFGT